MTSKRIPLPQVGDLVIDPRGPIGYIVGYGGYGVVNIKWIRPYGCLEFNEDGRWAWTLNGFQLISRNIIIDRGFSSLTLKV